MSTPIARTRSGSVARAEINSNARTSSLSAVTALISPAAALTGEPSTSRWPQNEDKLSYTTKPREEGSETEKVKAVDDVQVLDWDGPDDPTNPQNFSKTRKWLITGAGLLGTLILPLNGTSITVAAHEINARFGVSDATFPNSYWTVTSWSVGGAVFILLGLPLMEDLGVRLGYLIFYTFFVLMVIPQALAQNFATLIITRFLSGGCVTLLANTMAGIIPDVWVDDRARSVPVGLYILAYLMGSTLGPPIFAGVLHHTANWRWIFYTQIIIYGAFFPVFASMIVETRADVILRRRAKRLRKESGKQIYARTELSNVPVVKAITKVISRPFYLQATEPVLIMSTLWSAFSFGTVFVFSQSVGQVFIAVYNWPSYRTGYVQIAIVIGEILGWVASFYNTHLYFKSAVCNEESPGKPRPEARLSLSIFGSFFGITGGMFVYAWTASPSIHWILPAIGLAIVGFGIQLVISAVADYIEDLYAASGYAASAVSGVASGENLVAGFLPLATQKIYRELGVHWASSLLGFIALLLSFAPVIFVWKGKRFRERSPFMLSGGETSTNSADV